jgi:cytochrome c peroxidase
MGMGGREDDIVELLRRDGFYRQAFPQAFPRDADPYSLLNLLRATASFVRSIVSFDSPYDRFLRGDSTAMSKEALRGMGLFFSERLECFHCHGGYQFTDSSTHATATVESVGYHNNGLYNVDGNGAYPSDNPGLYEITGQRRDMGRFKAPSLRNIAVTAPYMHDGRIETLEDVLRPYEAGGRYTEEGTLRGVGRRNTYKSTFIKGFSLSDEERAEVLAFRQSLTDRSILQNPHFGDPFGSVPASPGAPQ